MKFGVPHHKVRRFSFLKTFAGKSFLIWNEENGMIHGD